MPTTKLNLVPLFIIIFIVSLPSSTNAQVEFPNPGHEGLNTKNIAKINLEQKTLNIGLWLQNRIMYNFSNIPGPGETNIENTTNYDFFRQRFRSGIDLNITDETKPYKVGTYFQLEYRGAWGGSSPIQSDPRDSEPINNPYNRLQSRGLRYAFVYYNYDDLFNLYAGILPLSDQFDNVLFDSDWDFSVGGIAFSGKFNNQNYRFAYIRYIDGIGYNQDIINNTNFYLTDYNIVLSKSTNIGFHLYHLDNNDNSSLLSINKNMPKDWSPKNETWYGINFKTNINRKTVLKGFILLNKGKNSEDSHSGFAFKGESITRIGKTKISINSIYTSGDKKNEVNRRFVTPSEIFGVSGFWSYTHLFTANGPSDVNDIGLEIGNSGAGLFTIQFKLDWPLYKDKLSAQIVYAWFKADQQRNSSKTLGTEASAMLKYSFSQNFNLEFGAAYADLGKFYSKNNKNLFEVFSRLQFTL